MNLNSTNATPIVSIELITFKPSFISLIFSATKQLKKKKGETANQIKT